MLLTQQNYDELVKFMRISEGIGVHGTLRELLFEPIAHNVLARGGKFKYRKLTGGRSNPSLPC